MDTELLGSELAGLNLPFTFDLGLLDLKMDLQAFHFSDTAPSSTAQAPTGAGEEQGGDVGPGDSDDGSTMTAADLVDTNSPEYIEVLCDNCGHKLFVKPPK